MVIAMGGLQCMSHPTVGLPQHLSLLLLLLTLASGTVPASQANPAMTMPCIARSHPPTPRTAATGHASRRSTTPARCLTWAARASGTSCSLAARRCGEMWVAEGPIEQGSVVGVGLQTRQQCCWAANLGSGEAAHCPAEQLAIQIARRWLCPRHRWWLRARATCACTTTHMTARRGASAWVWPPRPTASAGPSRGPSLRQGGVGGSCVMQGCVRAVCRQGLWECSQWLPHLVAQ